MNTAGIECSSIGVGGGILSGGNVLAVGGIGVGAFDDGGSPPDIIGVGGNVPCLAGMLGDMNCDGAVDSFDTDPFILALSNPGSYATTYPNCDPLNGDLNCDGTLDSFDISPFTACVSSPGSCECP